MKTISLLAILSLSACTADDVPLLDDGTYVLVSGEGHDTCDGRPWDVKPGSWSFDLEAGTASDSSGCVAELVEGSEALHLSAPVACPGGVTLVRMDVRVDGSSIVVYRERRVEFSFGACDTFSTYVVERAE